MDKMQAPINSTFDKPLPSNLDSERVVLGAVILDGQAIGQVAEFLMPDDFYSTPHRIIYRAMRQLFERNENIEPVLLTKEIQKTDTSATPWLQVISQLAVGLPFYTNLEPYLQTIKNKAIARNLIKACGTITVEAVNESDNITEIVDRAEQRVFNLRESNDDNSLISLSELVFASYQESVERCKSGEQMLGLKTGFDDIDHLTGGLQKTDLIIVAARPSMGKSSFALDLVKGITKSNAETVCAVFSLEMSRRQCTDRLICSLADIDSNRYRLGRLTQSEWERTSAAASELQTYQIYIDDKSAISPLTLKSKARRIFAERKRLDLIVVDYLQLMSGTTRSENRQQEVSEISRDLKSIAKDLNVPVVALSQLSRACEARSDKRPLLSDLRDSGGIEQDADIVAFIYRDEYYNPTDENAGVAELIFRKHRHGATDTIKLSFIKQFAKFGSYYR